MDSSLEAREPEAASEPSILQQSQTQAALLGTLRDRLSTDIDSLITRQASEIVDLRAHQATEEQAALASMMQLHQESAAYLASLQLHVEEERSNLAAEIASMQALGFAEGDILELNVGGNLMSTTRATLTRAPGPMLALMFGPRYADRLKRGSNGRIFLDYDPYCFEQILSYLRCKLIEHPARPVSSPVVQPASKHTFADLIHYLGFEDFMGLTCSDFRFDKAYNMIISEDGRAARGLSSENSTCFAVPAMQHGEIHFVRCAITKLSQSSWMYLGVTQLREPTENAETDSTSFGWSSRAEYVEGRWRLNTRLPGWCSGDELVFRIEVEHDQGLLSVWRIKNQQRHQIKLSCHDKKPYFFHFAVSHGSEAAIRLDPVEKHQHSFFNSLFA